MSAERSACLRSFLFPLESFSFPSGFLASASWRLDGFGLSIEPGPLGVGSGCSHPGTLSNSVPSRLLSLRVRGSRSPDGIPIPRPPRRFFPPMLGLSMARPAILRPSAFSSILLEAIFFFRNE